LCCMRMSRSFAFSCCSSKCRASDHQHCCSTFMEKKPGRYCQLRKTEYFVFFSGRYILIIWKQETLLDSWLYFRAWTINSG
jgi:hypothetical protein